MCDYAQSIVLDLGSQMCKAGISGAEQPSNVFVNVVGIPKMTMQGFDQFKDFYWGEEAIQKAALNKMMYPIEKGIVQDWDLMEKIFQHTYQNELQLDPAEQPILITESPFNARQQRERMAQMIFESFAVPAFCSSITNVLALLACGSTTGTVIDSGYEVSHSVPICEGYALLHDAKRLNLAGKDITRFLFKSLSSTGHNLSTRAEWEIAQQIKQNYCYVAQDYEEELQQAQNGSELTVYYELPDGHNIELNVSRFKYPEAMINPSIKGLESEGLATITFKSITRSDCEEKIQREMFGNIVLTGGNTMFPGMRARIEKEIDNLVSTNINIKVVAPERRHYSAWLGGSILSTMDSFQDKWITKNEYEENGPSIVTRKFGY